MPEVSGTSCPISVHSWDSSPFCPCEDPRLDLVRSPCSPPEDCPVSSLASLQPPPAPHRSHPSTQSRGTLLKPRPSHSPLLLKTLPFSARHSGLRLPSSPCSLSHPLLPASHTCPRLPTSMPLLTWFLCLTCSLPCRLLQGSQDPNPMPLSPQGCPRIRASQ